MSATPTSMTVTEALAAGYEKYCLFNGDDRVHDVSDIQPQDQSFLLTNDYTLAKQETIGVQIDQEFVSDALMEAMRSHVEALGFGDEDDECAQCIGGIDYTEIVNMINQTLTQEAPEFYEPSSIRLMPDYKPEGHE